MCAYFCIGFIDFMFAGKTLIDYTSLFSPYDFEKMILSLIILKMTKCNSTETLNKSSDLRDQIKFRFNEINESKDYFNLGIWERKPMSKKLSKYVAAFDCFDKTLIVLSATSGGVSIISFTSAIVGIVTASFGLAFSLTTEIIKKLWIITRNKKKKHNKVIMLAKSKWNSIENLISQALIDLEINRGEFKTIVNKKEKHEKMKADIKMIKVETN